MSGRRKGHGQRTGVVMKANKALKKLAKIEASLSGLIERYKAKEVQKFLQDAKASVVHAKKAVNPPAPVLAATDASMKAGRSKPQHPTQRR